MAIVSTMVKLLLAILAGFVFRKRGVLDDDMDRRLSQLVLQLTMPALVIASAAGLDRGEASLDSAQILRLIQTGFLFSALLIPISWLLVRLVRAPRQLRGTSMNCLIFSNSAFMGYPVVAAFLGSEAVFYTAVFHLLFFLVFFTVGTYLFQKDAEPDKPFKIGQFINPGIIASIIALAVYFTGIELPALVLDSLSFIGDLTSGLSLIVIGSGLGAYSLKQLFGQQNLYIISFLRLVIMPLIAIGFIRLFFTELMAIQVVALSVAMPVASSVAMGSTQYPEQGKFASQAVGLSTLLSMLTIPLWFLFLGG